MPDHLDERLRSLRDGEPLAPPSPVTIRRRGDLLRRRHTVAAVVGGVLAVSMVALPVSLLADGDRQAGLDPSDRPSRQATEQVTPQPTGQPSDEPDPPAAGILTVADLPQRDRLGAWEEADPDGTATACVPHRVAQDLGAESRTDQRFAAQVAGFEEEPPPFTSEIRLTVLDFASSDDAVDALQSVASWLTDCAAEDTRSGSGDWAENVDAGPPADGGFWQLYLRDAKDVCTDCDAVRFDRQGVVRVGDRLALVSLNEIGGPLQPGGLRASMGQLVQAVATALGTE